VRIHSQADLEGRQTDIDALCQAALYSWSIAPKNVKGIVFTWHKQQFRSRLSGFRVLIFTMDDAPLACHWGFVDEDAPTFPPPGWEPSAGSKTRRGKKRILPGALTPSQRFAILKRDGYCCRICGTSQITDRTVELHVDHITARSKGGSNDPMNLWTLCADCNRGKGSQDL
jgi:HNH endonuclease